MSTNLNPLFDADAARADGGKARSTVRVRAAEVDAAYAELAERQSRRAALATEWFATTNPLDVIHVAARVARFDAQFPEEPSLTDELLGAEVTASRDEFGAVA